MTQDVRGKRLDFVEEVLARQPARQHGDNEALNRREDGKVEEMQEVADRLSRYAE